MQSKIQRLTSLPKHKYGRRRKIAQPSVADYLTEFLKSIRSGMRLHNGFPYSSGTIEVWESFRRLYNIFDSEGILRWIDLDREAVDRFRLFLTKRTLMPTTINKYMICFRALAGYAYTDGIHTNHNALGIFDRRVVQENEKRAEIYLTNEEIKALSEMVLTGREDLVRDIFLIGCYTCQRVSDYSRLSPQNFTRTPRGTEIIEIYQKKTGKPVKIPILTPDLKRICLKYDYNFPRITTVELNRTIKKVLSRLADAHPSLNLLVATHSANTHECIIEEKMQPRWQLVSSHTARRSGLTNLYLSGRLTIMQLMHISGHTTFRNFKQYIRLSTDEIADEIAAAYLKES